MLGTWVSSSFGVIPEPDNIIYGQIAIGTNILVSKSTNFTVEARRSTDNRLLATYRMGENPSYGARYVLAIPLESVATIPSESTLEFLYGGNPVFDPNASLAGDQIRLVVKETRRIAGVLRTNTYYTNDLVLDARATVHVVNFGNITNSQDDGLPDAWQMRYGLTGHGHGDTDGDGVSDRDEYLAGTDPTNPNSVFRIHITLGTSEATVFFTALRAEGVGYEGRIRHYTLERNTDVLSSAGWVDLPGYTELVGANQPVSYSAPTGDMTTAFFRVRIRLTGP